MARGMPGFFDIDERLKDLSAKGDDLERIKALVDFEMFRRDLETAVPRADRSKVEHVFAHQKGLMGLVVKTIGIARARVKIGLANIAYNMRRLVWLKSKTASA